MDAWITFLAGVSAGISLTLLVVAYADRHRRSRDANR